MTHTNKESEALGAAWYVWLVCWATTSSTGLMLHSVDTLPTQLSSLHVNGTGIGQKKAPQLMVVVRGISIA